jgi:hypothetical protein
MRLIAGKMIKPLLTLGLLGALAAPAWSSAIPLNYETNGSGTTQYSNIAQVLGSGSYTYANTVPFTSGVVPGTTSGFYDDIIFTIGANQLDTIATTIDLLGVLGINDFQVRLFSVPDASAPGTTGNPGASLIDAWTNSVNCGTGCTGTVAFVSPTSFGAGTYDLQVRGTALSGGGSYSGVLNLTPVPVPAALPLLLSGLGLLGRLKRRRTAVLIC